METEQRDVLTEHVVSWGNGTDVDTDHLVVLLLSTTTAIPLLSLPSLKSSSQRKKNNLTPPSPKSQSIATPLTPLPTPPPTFPGTLTTKNSHLPSALHICTKSVFVSHPVRNTQLLPHSNPPNPTAPQSASPTTQDNSHVNFPPNFPAATLRTSGNLLPRPRSTCRAGNLSWSRRRRDRRRCAGLGGEKLGLCVVWVGGKCMLRASLFLRGGYFRVRKLCFARWHKHVGLLL